MTETTMTDPAMETDPFYTAANMAYLAKTIARIESGEAALSEHELIED